MAFLLTGCLVGLMLVTDPNTVILPFLILPFVLVGIIFYQIISEIFLVASRQKNSHSGKIIALSITSLGVGLLLLQSLNQLTWKDGLLTCLLAVLFWLYIRRADFLHK